MKKDTCLKILSVSLALLFCFVLGEVSVRLLGCSDVDGNYFIGWDPLKMYHLKPYRLPVLNVGKKVNRYLSSDSKPLFKYDRLVGWTFNPHRRSDINGYGMRMPEDISFTPEKGVLRIALFGDSFAAGADVSYEKTWGHRLENNLIEGGLNAEVLNFGVGGYGMDQAFLRWKELGYKFSPDIVIFGFQPENVKRNMNLIRAIYMTGTGIPFSKPRFILNDKEQLELINVPTIPPERLEDTIRNFDTWNLKQYEYFWNEEDYRDRIWLRSRFISFIVAAVDRFNFHRNEELFYSMDGEPSRLAMKIVEEFRKDVELHGAKFLIVHLPTRVDMSILLRGERPVYSGLLKKMKEENEVIDPEERLLEEVRKRSMDALVKSHYTERGYEIVGDVVSAYIAENIRQLTALDPTSSSTGR